VQVKDLSRFVCFFHFIFFSSFVVLGEKSCADRQHGGEASEAEELR
jgi:hypothetical protein